MNQLKITLHDIAEENFNDFLIFEDWFQATEEKKNLYT